MRYLFLFSLLFIFTACKEDQDNAAVNDENKSETELIELRNKVAQLELESDQKDSVLNEAISFYNEIQSNLAKINIKEDEIRVRSNNPELTQEDQEWILQEIQNINFLRKQNAQNVGVLKKRIADKDLKISELENMTDRLVMQIRARDEQIASLQRTLADLDMEYSELFDEYQEQVELALDVMKEMNTVYYAYGTLDELTANKVLVREGGFIGIGKKTNIAEDLNQEYFQSMNKTKVKEINIIGEKPEMVTDHPISSYKWNGTKLIILDAEKFWRISNYLVVTVD
jgi:DNA repair exonuclease SbcCD ATPase subunit